MEPMTLTLVAAVSIAASTQRPKWEASFTAVEAPTSIVVNTPVRTTAPLVERRMSERNATPVVSPKERLVAELIGFMPVPGDSDAGPVSRIDDILAANAFLQKLPGSIPLPVLMRTDDGAIGMYWDNEIFYIDVEIDSGNTLSTYTREIASGREIFAEDISLEEIDSEWFFRTIGMALGTPALAA